MKQRNHSFLNALLILQQLAIVIWGLDNRMEQGKTFGDCVSTVDCQQLRLHNPFEHFLCVRDYCILSHDLFNKEKLSTYLPDTSILMNDTCWKDWPDVVSCVEWSVSEKNGTRSCESNDVPPFYVPPYCPFGIGEGYCQSPTVGDSTDCPPFKGKKCPCDPSVDNSCPPGTPKTGDVMVATYQKFIFPLHPDPTDDSKPLHMYNNSALTSGNKYQVIGAHLSGVQLKGPAEANGFNVDTSLIPLPCGGHVTPPVGPGPIYHFHKAAECMDINTPGEHGPLIGYASDGFGIYGYGDLVGGGTVLDECHGHFGPVPINSPFSDSVQYEIQYHYHASSEYNLPGKHHHPYYMGCQGPSKGRCNSTVSEKFDGGANWCGSGCGFDICIQPGTDSDKLHTYLGNFLVNDPKIAAAAGAKWLQAFSVNPFAK